MLGQEGKTDFKPFHLRKTATQGNNTMWRQAVFIVMPELNNRYGSVSSELTPPDLVTEYSCVFHACRSATPRHAGWRAVRHYCIKIRQSLWIEYTLYKCDIHIYQPQRLWLIYSSWSFFVIVLATTIGLACPCRDDVT